ncbi:MAG TPA: hypothetical protein VFY23_01660 [Candidatus Limnocylindrales bacterium]|nr:hypothetical protein [Candidatus Limnocylindrales bacterium]
MAGHGRPAGEALADRVQEWGKEWRDVARCTLPADRAAAEAALAALYATDRRPAPEVLWVPSPSAGILAYKFASLSRQPVRGRWSKGDVGNGENQPFNALGFPFQMEPAWVLRTVHGLADRLPVPAGSRTRDPFDAAGERLGLESTTRTWRFLAPAIEQAAREPLLPESQPGPEAADVAGVVLGDAWPKLQSLVGDALARDIFLRATRQLLSGVLVDRSRLRDAMRAMQPGQWDPVTPLVAAARDVAGGTLWRPRTGRAERVALVDARLELARSAGPWWALEGLAIVSERPLVDRRDDRLRLHAGDGPALAWPDGSEVYAWHGVRVERDVVVAPETITPDAIDRQQNAEVRRVMVERFGPERLLREGGAILVAEDETGRLWRRDLGRGTWMTQRDEPLVMVEVRNSTPEPDGSVRTYFLRVPPTTTTPREGVAWTFNMPGWEYMPAKQT